MTGWEIAGWIIVGAIVIFAATGFKVAIEDSDGTIAMMAGAVTCVAVIFGCMNFFGTRSYDLERLRRVYLERHYDLKILEFDDQYDAPDGSDRTYRAVRYRKEDALCVSEWRGIGGGEWALLKTPLHRCYEIVEPTFSASDYLDERAGLTHDDR